MYIFEEDETGLRIEESLKGAAQRGINVFVVLDGFDSKNLTNKFISGLRNAGVNFRNFSPLFSFQNIYIGRRLHHKIIVPDSIIALIGGTNIGNKYSGTSTELPWLDYFNLIKGSVCEKVHKICEEICGKQFQLRLRFKKTDKELPITGENLIGFRHNNWLRKKNQIYCGYINNVKNAKKSLIIIASYFLPGQKLRKALEIAAKKDVKIKIILSGVSDVPIFRLATSYLYNYMHKHNIEIYEWKQSVLHGKMAVVDDCWTTTASFNLNHLSSHSSIELNVEVLNNDFAKKTEKHLLKIIQNGCNKIEGATLFNLKTKILCAVSYFLIRTSIKFLALFPNIKYLYTRIND